MEGRNPVNCHEVHIDTLKFGEKWVNGCISNSNESSVVGHVFIGLWGSYRKEKRPWPKNLNMALGALNSFIYQMLIQHSIYDTDLSPPRA